MMNAKDFAARLRANIQALRDNQQAETLRITLDLIALIRLRVQTEGLDYQESEFAPYTPGYARQRAKAGYQTEYVDFTRTGRLWASVQPEVSAQSGDVIEVNVGPRGQDNIDKARGARRKRGNITLPSESELAIARAGNEERIRKYYTI